MSLLERNRRAWNRESSDNGPWSRPVSPEVIAAARRGEWHVILTPNKPVPRDWFGDLQGRQVLGLASGGGQQVPVLAAAGALVTSFDLSDVQLEKDRLVASQAEVSQASRMPASMSMRASASAHVGPSALTSRSLSHLPPPLLPPTLIVHALAPCS